MDYKTGKAARPRKKRPRICSLASTRWRRSEVLDLTPERLVFYNLMTNEPVATTRDAKALAATKQKIAEVADQIRAGEFSAKPGFSCGYCDFKPLCPAHEQLISIQPAEKVAREKLNACETVCACK